MEQSLTDQQQKVKELIEDIRINMFITKEADGTLKARPMSAAKVEDDGSMWFFTNEYSEKVTDISHDNEVLLTYASPSKNSYLTLNGKALLSKDKSTMEALWNPAMKAWFPQGLEDPAIQLIKVEPSEAEYWDSSSNKIVIAYQMLRAMITGKQFDEGEHAEVTL